MIEEDLFAEAAKLKDCQLKDKRLHFSDCPVWLQRTLVHTHADSAAQLSEER